MITHSSKALLGLSGNGLLSSVVAALLKHQGYQVIAYHLKTEERRFQQAEKTAQKLGLQFLSDDATDLFENYVYDHIVHAVAANRKPEPVVMAHQKIIIDRLSKKAKELGCEKIATGHVARVALDPASGRTRLLVGNDREQDQSDLLFALSGEELRNFVLPIGELGAQAIARLVTELEMDPAKLERASRGFGVIPEAEFFRIASQRMPPTMKVPGQIKTAEGSVLGDHDGLYQYTRGQSKGLPLSRERLGDRVVVGFDSSTTVLILGREELLMAKEAVVSEVNWVQPVDPIKGFICEAKVRPGVYAKCRVTQFKNLYSHVEFTEPQKNLIPGQAIVFYLGDEVLGGGFCL